MVRRAVSRLGAVLVVGALAITAVAVATIAPAYADDPVPGGQTASPADSLFPNQGNSGYDVSHYDINFRVDVTVSSVHNAQATTSLPNAQATIQAATTGAPLSSFSLDFQGSSGNLAASTLNVDSVTVNGVAATFSRIENTTTSNATTDVHKLVVTPAVPVDGAFTTVVSYHGAPVRHQDTDGSSEGWNNTTDGATFLNQPVGSMTLFPNNNTPRDKATYTFTIDAPSRLTSSNLATGGGTAHPAGVVSNGELLSKTVNGDRTTWVWDQAEPMASELSMVSVGRYDIYESDIHLELSNRTIHEWTFIDPAISQANQTTTLSTRAQLKAVLDFFESKYGPYPGNSTGLVTDVVPRRSTTPSRPRTGRSSRTARDAARPTTRSCTSGGVTPSRRPTGTTSRSTRARRSTRSSSSPTRAPAPRTPRPSRPTSPSTPLAPPPAGPSRSLRPR